MQSDPICPSSLSENKLNVCCTPFPLRVGPPDARHMSDSDVNGGKPGSCKPILAVLTRKAVGTSIVIVHSSPTAGCCGVIVTEVPAGISAEKKTLGLTPATLSSMQMAPEVGHVAGPA